jgi:hypothetical protein
MKHQEKQGIQSYIADVQWNIRHRESNHILILLNEILSD